jgi:anti-sigma B factor antagonist
MSGNLGITEKRVDTVDVVSIRGRLDASSSQDAEKRINALLDGGSMKILINLAELDYISSSGLRVMLAALKRLKKTGGDLKLACLKPAIQDVFSMAGFHRIFAIYGSEAEALESFGAAA